MTKQEFIVENAKYLDERVAANLEQIPDDLWAAVVAGTNELTHGGDEPGIDCDVVITRETVADFDNTRSTHWNESGARRAVDCGGRPAVLFEKFQRAKGQPRDTILVIDCGELTVVLK